jgi:hypothetical protein
LLILVFAVCCAAPAQAQLWKKFTPDGANPQEPRTLAVADTRANAPVPGPQMAGEENALTQENGPWLIVAASFSGDGSEEQSQALANELRSKYGLAAYIHQMNFKLGDDRPGRGLDEYGAPVRRRYQRDEVRELAVLVGDFPSVDDPQGQRILERVKTLLPDALNKDVNETAQSMAQVRKFEDALLEKLGKSRKRGPMAKAFLTRNPLLPREYFVPKGVDPFVAKMNEGVEHSLLDCPGSYSIRVATFQGKSVLQTSAKEEEAMTKSFWGRRKKQDDNPLIEAAENAHLLTQELRTHGWEAYEFHDRNESIVTIGSFAQVAQKLPDGRVLAAPNVERIIKTFGAAYDTPADPLSGIGNDPTNQQLVQQQEQQVKMQLSGQQGQLVPGMNPKHVKILKGSGKRMRVARIIPIDIYPQAIEVPKRSVSSAYAG